jgi:hypothetical protein
VQSGAFPAREHTYKANQAHAAHAGSAHDKRSSETWKLDEPLALDHWH